MSPEQIIAMVKRLQAAGLVYPGEGTITEWTLQFRDTNPELAWDACTKIISNAVRGPVTIGQVKAAINEEAMWGTRNSIPRQHECLEHPGNYGYNCPECRKRLESPEAKARMEAVRQEARDLAKKAALERKARTEEREAEQQRALDESARRIREKLEKQRQLDAYEAQQPD